MNRSAAKRWILGVGLGGLCSCAAYDLPRAEIEQLCARWNTGKPGVTGVRRETSVTMRSPGTDGEFQGVLVARHEPVAVRLQLFPELGGKVLDLVATRQLQRGMLPMTGQRLDYPAGASRDRLLRMFAISLLEAHAPLPPDRVLGGWRGGASRTVRLRLQPWFGASQCEVAVDLEGGGRVFEMGFGGARWRMRIDAGGTVEITARGFSLRAAVDSSEDLTEIDSRLFELRGFPSRQP